jgi:long-chain acyl-CoA synthetase
MTGSAVIAPEGTLDVSALDHTADRAAQRFSAAGVPAGALVALMLPNSLAFVPAYVALRKLFATVALIPPKYGAAELEAIRRGLAPQCFVTTRAAAEAPGLAARRVEVVDCPCAGEPLAVVFPWENEPTSFAPPGTVLLKFTSGSTGQPKGVALDAANLETEAANIVNGLGICPEDVILAPVPLSHSYGFDLGVLALLRAGCTLALEDAFVPRRTLRDLASGRVTVFLGVPAMYRACLALPPDADAAPRVRYLLSCTAPLPPSVIGAFYARYDAAICQHYGSSETGAVTTHVPGQVLERPDSVGRPMGDVALNVVDAEGRPVAPGTEGEVLVSSGAVSHGGYVLGGPTGRTPFQPGGCHTGDLGRLADGFLYVQGRVDDLINVGGFKVSPREVIDALESYPAVSEAAVVGVRAPSGEEVVYAAVTLSRAATEADILAHCRSRLAEYKIPRRVDIQERLQHSPTGKVQLRAQDVRL